MVEDEQRGRDDAREAASKAERRVTEISSEMEELRGQLEQVQWRMVYSLLQTVRFSFYSSSAKIFWISKVYAAGVDFANVRIKQIKPWQVHLNVDIYELREPREWSSNLVIFFVAALNSFI